MSARITVAYVTTLLAGAAAHSQTPLPDDFNPGVLGGELPAVILSMAVQSDHKIVAGGIFARLNGQARTGLARLNQDGSLDTGFNPTVGPAPFAHVTTLAMQSDGKIVVAGDFTSLDGQARGGLGRLNPDGSLDPTFSLGIDGDDYPMITSLLVHADDRILVGGRFSTLGGQSRQGLGRLNADGSLDSEFRPEVAGDFPMPGGVTLILQPDGKVLVGGVFDRLAGQPRDFIGRLNPDGTLDKDFNPGADAPINVLALQADGKVLAAGFFETIAGQVRPGFARLNPDGSLDPTFEPPTLFAVYSMAIQADGRILVGGDFAGVANEYRGGIVRLEQDGSVDSSFDARIGGEESPAVLTISLQRDGRILLGGAYSSLGGQPRSGLGRLYNTGTSTETLSRNGSTLTWLRGGTGPEVWRAEFEYSVDGVTWVELGQGTRVKGGWQLSESTIPDGAMTRVRGQVAGSFDGSNWYVETPLAAVIQAPTATLELNSSSMTLSWSGQPGVYLVQRTTSLIPPIIWEDIRTVEASGSLSLPLQAGDGYFRVRQQ